MKLGSAPVMGLGPIPEGTNAVLVERRDTPGALAVAVRHGRYVCPLPEGYDGLTSVVTESGWVLVTHPTLPPLIADPHHGIVRAMDARLLPKNLLRAALTTNTERIAP